MDFQQLLARMAQLDQPVGEAAPVVEQPVVECPPDMPTSPMATDSNEPKPSMSVNLNAQGLDNISDILKLIAKVNPDTEKPADTGLPSMGDMPNLTPPGPKLGGLGNLDAGPLKMLPDFDADNDDAPGGEHDIEVSFGGDEGPEADNDMGPEEEPDGVTKAQGDIDNDGDHDMDDHDMEKEAFGNSVNGSEPEEGDIDDVVRVGDDLNKPKQMFKRAQPGDNPMAMEGAELRAAIRAELLQRLAEVKGAK